MAHEIPVDSPRGEPRAPLPVEPVDAPAAAYDPCHAGFILRVFSFICAVAVMLVVSIAFSLDPDPRGHGTHERLGLAPCGFRFTTGMPCPTCGVTTAFSEMVHLRLLAALVHQPFGAILFLLVFAAGLGWLYTAATGRRWPLWIGSFLRSSRFLYGMLGLFLASWGYTLLLAWLQNRQP